MNSSEVRQSFLDYFAGQEHVIVPSAPLLPSSPNLLFTNAGMNQFVPYFLGERAAPYRRAADTQKCIRAGGKHNDLEDVGFDAYHHTLFEMLGNWSFGDYFKKEAIRFAWELLTDVWKFPKERLYATVYKPGEGDPADFDAEAYGYWKEIFEAAGLDPEVHIVFGGKKDNFWMMGETGPCGPCSELHIDLTPAGDSCGALVNADSPWCIEIWNLVFIQFNAEEDGSFKPLPARHVDTGMGFERVAGILATTKNFTEFTRPPSNYSSDLFSGIFEHLAGLCGHQYAETLPENREHLSDTEFKDCAYRVIADHIRTLSFSIADGILPGNEGRNYVLRRILRRAIMFGKRLELPAGFFTRLAPVLIAKMGDAFPELRTQATVIEKVLASEESAFDKTIDRGLNQFRQVADAAKGNTLPGEDAFTLYDTYGFPLDLTQLLARERGLQVDAEGFERAMEAQRARGRAAQKKETIRLADGDNAAATRFVGFDTAKLGGHRTRVVEVVNTNDSVYAVFESTPLYAEMGGQTGDTGTVETPSGVHRILDTKKDASGRFLHQLEADAADLTADTEVRLQVDGGRRAAIQRHHSATHLLNWALRTVLGNHVRQAGSLVEPGRLRFDFNHYEAVNALQIAEIERLVTTAILNNSEVKTYETAFDDKPDDVIAVFGEKYGDRVRVVDIGGYSKELCGGTHVANTGEIGLCKVVSESGIAAGTRRIEAVVGEAAFQLFEEQFLQQSSLAQKLACRPADLAARIDTVITRSESLERELREVRQKLSAAASGDLVSTAKPLGDNGLRYLTAVVEAAQPNDLRSLGSQLLAKIGPGALLIGAEIGGKATVVAFASPEAIAAGHRAGDWVRSASTALGGKGGGKPDFAMGGAPDASRLTSVIEGFNPGAQ